MKKYLFILFWLISWNLYANGCPGQFDPQSGICRFQGHNGELVQYNIAPPQGNTSPQKKIIETTIIHKASKYGAIALDKKTGMIGDAINANSLVEAKKSAIRQCAQSGKAKNCKVVSWTRNGCFAAAGGNLQGKLSLFTATRKPNQAESVAMRLCQAAGVTDCRIVVPEGCSIPDGMYN